MNSNFKNIIFFCCAFHDDQIELNTMRRNQSLYMRYSPANGASPWYSSTQSVELDNETELREPLEADAGDLFKSNLPEHLLYSYCYYIPLCIMLITEMRFISSIKEWDKEKERNRDGEMNNGIPRK
jgi:hypothetical protein